MRGKRFSEEKIMKILKEGEAGVPILELCRKHEIGQSTYFAWRSKYSGMSLNELKRLKQLEDENNRLKRMYASLSLDHELLKEVLEKKLGVDVSEEISHKD